MKRLIAILLTILVSPLAVLFIFGSLFQKKDTGIFSGTTLFEVAHADIPGGGVEGAEGGGVQGVAESTGGDAGGNAAAQGNSSGDGVQGTSGDGTG